MNTCKPRSHCPGFQSRWRYSVDTGAHRDKYQWIYNRNVQRRWQAPHWLGIYRVEPAFTGNGFNNLKQPGLTGTHRGAIQRRLIPEHHRSSSGMNRISTVRPQGDTIANRHELCPRWRYGDSRLSHGVSRRRAGKAPVELRFVTVAAGECR